MKSKTMTESPYATPQVTSEVGSFAAEENPACYFTLLLELSSLGLRNIEQPHHHADAKFR